MLLKTALRVVILLAVLGWRCEPARSQQTFVPGFDDLLQVNLDDQGKDQKKQDKGKPPPDLVGPTLPVLPPAQTPPPSSNPFDLSATGSGTQAENSTAGFNPHMMGDFGTIYSRQVISVTSLQTVTTTTTTTSQSGSEMPKVVTTTTTTTVPVTTTRVLLVPVASGGAFNVAENESARPTDRVFGFYNFFDDIRGVDLGPSTHTQTTTSYAPGTTTTVQTTTVTPGAPPQSNLNREVIGFEKTFFNGSASVEVRLPLLQQQGGGFNEYEVGDLTIVGKYAFLLDPASGNVVSGGLAVTAPTGPAIPTAGAGNFRTTLLQPWAGYIWNFDRFYVQGIHSIVVPTSVQDPMLMFNDLGINYWLYRGSPSRFLSSVVPVLEAHVTTPLNHNSTSDPLFVPDVVILTTGVHLGIYRNGLLTLGVATPVTGPTVFSIETFAQFNWYF